MAKKAYIGVDGVAREAKGIYLGIDGVARKIKKAYIGDENGLARLWYEDGPAIPAGEFLTFASPNSFTIKISSSYVPWDGMLEYSTDAINWVTWNETITMSAVANGGWYFLHIRGTGNTNITGQTSNGTWLISGEDVRCYGNIETLLDYATVAAGEHPTMANGCYSYMFYGCTSLTQAPSLPATTLTSSCYMEMFYGCTSLTQAPSLPATTLTSSCYMEMFYGCTSLTQAPSLPATTLTSSCYREMFYGCTSLTQIPALPATTIPWGCYDYMFSDCTGIKLSATQTGEYTQPYRIPVSGDADNAWYSPIDMFSNTGGTFTGSPPLNTTYYLSNTNTVV